MTTETTFTLRGKVYKVTEWGWEDEQDGETYLTVWIEGDLE